MSEKQCFLCGYKFSNISQKYYCHNKNQFVCIMCRRQPCPICNSIRSNIVTVTRCKKCYTSTLDQSKMFYQHQCDSFFCSRCLLKSTVKQQNTILPCGHAAASSDVKMFLKQHCCKCGNQFNYFLDYEMLDSTKICSKCWRIYRFDYQKDIIRCIACQNQIRNYKQVSYSCEDLILCKLCFQRNNYQQINLENDAKHLHQNSYQKKLQVRQNNFINQKQIMKEKKPQALEVKKQQKKESSDFVPFNFKKIDKDQPQIIIDNESISLSKRNVNNIKKQEKKIQQKEHQQDINIKEELQQQKKSHQIKQQKPLQQIIDKKQDTKIKLSKQKYSEIQEKIDGKITKIKKYYSTETEIQNIKINIKKDNPQDQYIECQNCCYQILKNDSLVYQSNQDNKRLCKLCYMIKNASTSGYLGFSSKNIDLGNSRNKHLSTAKYTSPLSPQSPKKTFLNMNNNLYLTNTFSQGISDQKLTKTTKGSNQIDYNKFKLNPSQTNTNLTNLTKQKQYNIDSYKMNLMKSSIMNQSEKKKIELKDSVKKTEFKNLNKKCFKCGKQTRSFFRTLSYKNQQVCQNCYNNRRY